MKAQYSSNAGLTVPYSERQASRLFGSLEDFGQSDSWMGILTQDVKEDEK
jgi:hypothetical protein